MRKVLFAFLAFVLCFGSLNAKNKQDKETLAWRYEIEPTVGQAKQGSSLIKVWSYAKTQELATKQAAKNAVHGILFKGYAGSTDDTRIIGQKPIITDANVEVEKADFFKEFFADGGAYLKFVTVVSAVPEAGDFYKIGKEVKLGLTVVVMKDELRKYMEQAGIISTLGGNVF